LQNRLCSREGGYSVLYKVLVAFQVLFSIGLVTSILMQSGRASGLSGAIAGGATSLLGKKKGLDEFLNKISIVMACGFMLLTLSLAFFS
jgi:preprotein translocase subunit SecG